MDSNVFEEQVESAKTREVPFGVHVCPIGNKVHHSVRPNARIRTYGVGRTNAEELNPVGSIACYATKGGKGELIPCKVEEYRHKVGKAVISVKNAGEVEVRVVSEHFIRPLSVLTAK